MQGDDGILAQGVFGRLGIECVQHRPVAGNQIFRFAPCVGVPSHYFVNQRGGMGDIFEGERRGYGCFDTGLYLFASCV